MVLNPVDSNTRAAALLVWLYVTFWFLVRPLGPVPLIALLCLVAFLVRPSALLRGWGSCAKWCVVFAVLVSVVAVASALEQMPFVGKYFFSVAVIPQQALYVITLPLGVAFWSSFFLVEKHQFHPLVSAAILISTWLVASILQMQFGELDEEPAEAFLLGTLHSSEMIQIFILAYIMLVFIRRIVPFLVVGFVLIVIANSAQSLLAVLAIFAVRFVGRRIVAAAVIVLLPLTFIIASQNASSIYDIDPNSGVRALFWRDVISDFINSFGLGIGFGNEAIAPQYQAFEHAVTIIDPDFDRERFLTTGTHNSFMDILQRLGLMGIVVFSLMLFIPILQLLRSREMTDFDGWAIVTLMITLSVNVALSVAFIFGTTMLWGWIVSRWLLTKYYATAPHDLRYSGVAV